VGKTIRIPRTTALFVTGLSRILREEFGFKITEHEHWTFRQVGQWETCGSPGACPVHGISKEAYEVADRSAYEAYPDDEHARWHHAEMFYVPCYEFKNGAYIGIGQSQAVVVGRGRFKLDLRVRIEQSCWTAMPSNGDMTYIVQVWVRDEDGNIQNGEFGLHDDGQPYRTENELPDNPPRKIAFWRSAEEALA
jgi:hypothetical protein